MVDCYTTFPYVDLRASAATSISHNQATYTKVNLATTTHNDTDFYTVTASVVTIVADGVYDLNIGSGFATGSSFGEFAICVNGLTFSDDIRRFKIGVATAADQREGSLTELSYALEAGDTIQIGAYQLQSSGSTALNTIANSRLLVRKVG